MSRTGCPETSVINYHFSLLNNAEERSSAVGPCSINSKDQGLKLLGCYAESTGKCLLMFEGIRMASYSGLLD